MLATISGETLNIINKNDCEIEIEDFFKELRNDISLLKDCPVIDEEKLVSKSISHSLFKYDKYNKNVSAIKNIIFSAAIDCEKYIGGSADTFLLILEKTLSLHKDERLKYVNHSLEQSMKYLLDKRRLSKKDIKSLTKDMTDESKEIVNNVISKCSPKTLITLEKSNFIENKIIQKETLFFDIKPIPGFVGSEWLKEEVNILMVDGIIESVSQIHHLLTQAYETKEPFLLISRAYNPEVLKTIAENKAKGLIDMIPIDLGFSNENHHVLSDISRIFNIDYASPDLGDVISVFVRRGLKKIKKVKITNYGVDFYIDDQERLETVRNEVFELALKNLGSEVDVLIQKRIKSLSTDRVSVLIGKDSIAKNPIIIEELDIFIRRFKNLIRDGVIFTKIKDIDKIKKIYSSIEIPFILNKIKSVLRSIDSISCIITRR